MKRYRLIIDDDAKADLEDGEIWYNSRAEKLGDRFKKEVKRQISGLRTNATGYALRYKSIHCMPIEKFPYMAFTVDEKNGIVKILAVIHTSRNPDIWDEKTKNA